MDEQVDVVSPKHILMLNVATWAKYLAWAVIVFSILLTFSAYVVAEFSFRASASSTQSRDFIHYIMNNPIYGGTILVEILANLVRGLIYFLLLNGISLGLSMIVETDINYRNRAEEKNEQRTS